MVDDISVAVGGPLVALTGDIATWPSYAELARTALAADRPARLTIGSVALAVMVRWSDHGYLTVTGPEPISRTGMPGGDHDLVVDLEVDEPWYAAGGISIRLVGEVPEHLVSRDSWPLPIRHAVVGTQHVPRGWVTSNELVGARPDPTLAAGGHLVERLNREHADALGGLFGAGRLVGIDRYGFTLLDGEEVTATRVGFEQRVESVGEADRAFRRMVAGSDLVTDISPTRSNPA
ncbi:MAG: DUF2470 domain-containing protein [Desertimonas sp.]